MSDLVIERCDIGSPAARAMIALAQRGALEHVSRTRRQHFRLDPAEVVDGSGAFLIATRDAQPIGCGAVRRIAALTGEIKRDVGDSSRTRSRIAAKHLYGYRSLSAAVER
jgi:hypothetical protein